MINRKEEKNEINNNKNICITVSGLKQRFEERKKTREQERNDVLNIMR
jgi:hypothetical protein